MYKHVIPVNMMDNGEFLNGLLKKRNCIEAGIWAVFTFLLIKSFSPLLPFMVTILIGAGVCVVPGLLLVIGVGEYSVGEFIVTMVGFRRQKRILKYSLASCLKEEEENKETKKTQKKEKKKQKKEKEEKPKMSREEKKIAKIKAQEEKKIRNIKRKEEKKYAKKKQREGKKKK